MNSKSKAAILLFFLYTFSTLSACSAKVPATFNGEQALDHAQTLMSFGFRTPGSTASENAAKYIQEELSQLSWQVDFQEFTHQDVLLRNIIAKKSDVPPDVILAAHYDTRALSDQESDPELQSTPVPGANDGTSGTAVLMELARALGDKDVNIWLVFFDGEDQGHINDWDWSVGAQYFADQLEAYPEKVVVIDMIGDADLNIYRERNSDQALTDDIWEIADSEGFSRIFINEEKYTMMDDHIPFANLGIPVCLLIDFDYPYWHTQADTLDKISDESMGTVGQVILDWILNQ